VQLKGFELTIQGQPARENPSTMEKEPGPQGFRKPSIASHGGIGISHTVVEKT
jgi:hypothetical protein